MSVGGAYFAAENPWNIPLAAIAGFPFDAVTSREALSRIEAMIASRSFHHVVTANIHCIVQAMYDAELHRIVCDAPLVVCDGMPLILASSILAQRLPERITGIDLTTALLRRSAEKGYRVFFLGGQPEVAVRAVTNVYKLYPQITLAGHYSPPFTSLEEMNHEEIHRRVLAARPDILFVSFGCPKSEKWISRYGPHLGCPVAISVGATIDLLAQRIRRAPLWMQSAGLEWLFRMYQEPARLLGRYLGDMAPITSIIIAQWLMLQVAPAGSAMQRRMRLLLAAAPNVRRQALCFTAHALSVEPPVGRLTRLEVNGCLSARALKLSNGWDGLAEGWTQGHILLNLSRVACIDSSGVAFLLCLHRLLYRTGNLLVLVAPSRPVVQGLHTLGLDRVLWSASSEETARRFLTEYYAPSCGGSGPITSNTHPRGKRERSAFRQHCETNPSLSRSPAELRLSRAPGA